MSELLTEGHHRSLHARCASLTEENERQYAELRRLLVEEQRFVDSLTDAETQLASERARRNQLEGALSAIIGASPQSYDWYRNKARAALSPIDPPLAQGSYESRRDYERSMEQINDILDPPLAQEETE